jgi:hypothetical protein
MAEARERLQITLEARLRPLFFVWIARLRIWRLLGRPAVFPARECCAPELPAQGIALVLVPFDLDIGWTTCSAVGGEVSSYDRNVSDGSSPNNWR